MSASATQGGHNILFAIYMDPLIMQLRRQGLGCRLLNEFYGCLLYADDILLITPTVYAMHMMLRICDKFADDFDMKFNCGKSFAMLIGKRFNKKCVSLQVDNKYIVYVKDLKYLGVHVSAGLFLKFSVEHLYIFMVALCNRADHYFILFLLLSSFFFFFSSPNLSSRRLDVYHTSAHGVVLV